MEQDPTYRQFDPLGTWDSPENLSAGSNRIALYLNVHDSNTLDTRLQVFTGLGTLFETDFPLRIASTPDGVSNTILFTESATLIPWASPRDLAYNRWQTIPSLGHPSVNYVLVTMADGSVRSVKKSINPAPLHALIQRNDGVAIPPNAFD